MIKNVDISVITQNSSQIATLEPCIKAKVGTFLTSYNFLVADHQYSAALLSYKSLGHFSEVCTSYWLAALQHIPCLHRTFDGNGASYNTDWSLSIVSAMVFLALTQLTDTDMYLSDTYTQ